MSSSPWLSVVIPAYRGERWIAAALDSLAAQAVSGFEIVLIDGGPSGSTVELARAYGDRLTIAIFERPDLASWHAKTNYAVEMAKAAYICWLGVDDVWLPGRAEAVRRWIANAPAVPLHLAASSFIDEGGRTLGLWRCPLPPNQLLSTSCVWERLLVQNFVAAPAPVFRRDAWLRCGGLDERLWYTADWDIWLKLAGLGSTVYHDEVTIGFRIHGGALTITGSGDQREFGRQMRAVLDRHLAAGDSDSKSVERTARASIEVNVALAAAAAGDFRRLPRAVWAVLCLGPGGIWRYVRDSRIWERMLPRIRARIHGSL